MAVADRPPFLLDAEGRLEAEVPCDSCGYNLRGARPAGTCPECGHAVSRSLAAAADAGRREVLTLRTLGPLPRTVAVLLGVVLPLVCFGIVEADGDPLLIDWQSGKWHEMVGLLLGGVPARPLYPLLLLSMASVVALTVQPVTAARHGLVRLGVYSGVVLGAMFCLIQFTAIGAETGLALTMIGLAALGAVARVLVSGPARLMRILSWRHWWKVRLALVLPGLAVAVPLFGPGVVLLGLLAAPVLTTVVFLMLTVRVLRSLPALGLDVRPVWPWWWGGWIGVYLASMEAAIALAIETYARLPTRPPGCYIATAAARGHRRLVGSRSVTLPGGEVLRVNRQLRSLKCLELALATLAPGVHRRIRGAYDWIGPPLAKRMTPVGADVAYLLLEPVHHLADLGLRCLVPRYDALRDRLFAVPGDGDDAVAGRARSAGPAAGEASTG